MHEIEAGDGFGALSSAVSQIVIFETDIPEIKAQKINAGYYISASDRLHPDEVVTRVNGWSGKNAKQFLEDDAFFEELAILVAARAEVLGQVGFSPENARMSLFASSDSLLRIARISIMGNQRLYGLNGNMPDGVVRAVAASERRIRVLQSFQTALLPNQPATLY